MHPVEHFKTVFEHRKLVREHCFRLGLYRQGLMHDLSKYSPVEFWRGAMHHKGRNKHHFEYWIDYIINDDGSVGFGGNRMPKRYIAEMFCDRVAACKVYLGDKYTDASAYDYYIKGTGTRVGPLIHPDTAAELEKMLLVLKEEGEDAAFEYVRKWLKEK